MPGQRPPYSTATAQQGRSRLPIRAGRHHIVLRASWSVAAYQQLIHDGSFDEVLPSLRQGMSEDRWFAALSAVCVKNIKGGTVRPKIPEPGGWGRGSTAHPSQIPSFVRQRKPDSIKPNLPIDTFGSCNAPTVFYKTLKCVHVLLAPAHRLLPGRPQWSAGVACMWARPSRLWTLERTGRQCSAGPQEPENERQRFERA